MAEERSTAGAGDVLARAAGSKTADRPATGVIYWRYLIFWLLLFGVLYFISLYGIVAEA